MHLKQSIAIAWEEALHESSLSELILLYEQFTAMDENIDSASD